MGGLQRCRIFSVCLPFSSTFPIPYIMCPICFQNVKTSKQMFSLPLFNNEKNSCQIEPGWHAWMSYLVDKPPTEDQLLQTGQRPWELPTHTPNLTATRGAYKPYSTYVFFFFFFGNHLPFSPPLFFLYPSLRPRRGFWGCRRSMSGKGGERRLLLF